MLLVLFGASRRSAHYAAVEKLIATDELVQRDLRNYVLAKLPVDHTIQIKGESSHRLCFAVAVRTERLSIW